MTGVMKPTQLNSRHHNEGAQETRERKKLVITPAWICWFLLVTSPAAASCLDSSDTSLFFSPSVHGSSSHRFLTARGPRNPRVHPTLESLRNSQ